MRRKSAHKLVQEIDGEHLNRSQMKGYSYQEISKTYGGIEQRWLVVESQQRRESDLKSLEKKIQKERVEVDKKLRSLKSENFASDAETATRKLLKKFLYHEFKEINVQFVESKSNRDFPYKVQVKVGLRELKIELEKKRAGRF